MGQSIATVGLWTQQEQGGGTFPSISERTRERPWANSPTTRFLGIPRSGRQSPTDQTPIFPTTTRSFWLRSKRGMPRSRLRQKRWAAIQINLFNAMNDLSKLDPLERRWRFSETSFTPPTGLHDSPLRGETTRIFRKTIQTPALPDLSPIHPAPLPWVKPARQLTGAAAKATAAFKSAHP